MSGVKVLISSALILIILKVVSANVQVKTSGGVVEGIEVKSILKDEKYYSFFGIPYGEPPVGSLRFMPPKPHKGWEGVLKATKEPKPCAQFNLALRDTDQYGFFGVEDCLHLTIHTSKIPSSSQDVNLPVIVLFINEQFRISHNISKEYGPDFFMKEDVIIVSVSHRLASLGFLSMEDDLLPGNNGIRDVILALKWIKKNINNFGGNPNKITLMGQQGGAALVEILLYSPKAKGLYHGAIMHSGTIWHSTLFTGKARERAIEFSKQMEEHASTTSFMLKRFADVSAEKLLESEHMAVHADEARAIQRGIIPFGPVIEHDHPEAIITKLPEEGPINIDVPVMIGYTSRDGLEVNKNFYVRPQFLTFADRDFLVMMPIRTGFHITINSNIYFRAVKDIKDFYFDEGYVKNSKPGEFVTYMSDVASLYPIDYAVRKYSNESKSDVFYYTFDYSGEFNMRKIDALKGARNFDGTWGATVGDDLCYLLVCKKIKKEYKKAMEEKDSEEMQVLNNMVRLWTNFAKKGNPTPTGDKFTWIPASSKNKECLLINEELQMKTKLHEDKIKFWDDWIEKYKAMAKDNVVKDEL